MAKTVSCSNTTRISDADLKRPGCDKNSQDCHSSKVNAVYVLYAADAIADTLPATESSYFLGLEFSLKCHRISFEHGLL
jgi:hypothetical protein